MDTLVDYVTHGAVIRPIGLDCPARCNAVSRNLRGLRDYARRWPVVCVLTKKREGHENDPGGILHVVYGDGSIGRAEFNSHGIMIDFIRNRRTWRTAETRHLSGDVGYLTKPGVIGGPKS